MLDVDLALRRLFETPTIAALAAEIGVQRAAVSDRAGTRLARVPRENRRAIPLSFAQQRLWFLEQLEGNLTAYNMPFAVRLWGPLDAESLRRALETILQRHEPLRTTFRLQDGEPLQVIQPPSRFDLPLVVLGDLPPEQREAALRARRRDEALRAFDLNADSMLRASLVRLADEEHVLLLTLHHIAADGWSIRLLWRELEVAYAAYRRNEAPALGELPIQYADYAVWQRERLQGERLQAELDYWRKQLAGLEPLELPTDRARPPQASYQGARHDFEVPRALVDQLRRLSRREGATLHMTLLAAFQMLLGAVQRAGGHRRRAADRGPAARGAGAVDRLLREHAGVADGPVGSADVPGIAGPSPAGVAGGLRSSGPAVREAGGGTEPGTASRPQSALPGDVSVAGVRGG